MYLFAQTRTMWSLWSSFLEGEADEQPVDVRLRFSAISIVLATLLAANPLSAGAQSVVARVDADSVSIGERATLVLYAAHDGARRAVFPDDRTDIELPPEAVGVVGDFELLRRRASGWRTLADGSRLDSVVY